MARRLRGGVDSGFEGELCRSDIAGGWEHFGNVERFHHLPDKCVG